MLTAGAGVETLGTRGVRVGRWVGVDATVVGAFVGFGVVATTGAFVGLGVVATTGAFVGLGVVAATAAVGCGVIVRFLVGL